MLTAVLNHNSTILDGSVIQTGRGEAATHQASNVESENTAIFKTLDEFLATVEKRAYRMAYIACSNEDEAMDIVQDSMMLLVQKYSQKSPQEWRPLFFRILQSRIVDWYRKNALKHRIMTLFSSNNSTEENDLYSTEHATTADPMKQTLDEMTLSAIENALRSLPIRQQQTFLLRAWQGMSTEETAQALSVSQGSVKTHFSRATAKLRELLEDHR